MDEGQVDILPKWDMLHLGCYTCTAAQPAAGEGSRQSRRRLFERREHEEQRLKLHDIRWMDIQQSLLSCVD